MFVIPPYIETAKAKAMKENRHGNTVADVPTDAGLSPLTVDSESHYIYLSALALSPPPPLQGRSPRATILRS